MKRKTLFIRLLLLIIMAIVIVALIIGIAFIQLSKPVFTKSKAGEEILPKTEAVVQYYQQYIAGSLSLHEMQAAISVSGTLSNAQLHIYDQSGNLVIYSLDTGEDFEFAANSPEMLNVTQPVAMEAMQGLHSIYRTVRDRSYDREYMVVAAPVITDGELFGAVVLTSAMVSFESPLQRMYTLLLASSVAAFLIMLLPLMFFLRRMVKPLQQINSVALSMAQGDFTQRADETSSGEIGELAGSINHLAQQLGRTVQALMLERNRLQRMLDGLAEGILALDEHGGILHTNPALYRLLGIEVDEENLPKAMGEFDGDIMEDIRSVAHGGQPLARNIGHGDVILHVMATPITDEQGQCRGAVALFHDITESERLEQTRRDYVANVSHELRTPLSAVRSLTETLQDGLIKTPQDRSRYYGYILRECMRLSRLVEDLLELSRLQSGSVALQKGTVELSRICTDIHLRYATIALDLGIEFSVACEPDCPPVYSNADRIMQVLVILLDNAFKFAQEGGHVKLYTTHDEHTVTVYVQDDGEGIDKEDLPHVFERFYKAEKSHSGGGTGLGLSIAREVLTLMGETIAVESERGVGTTFRFTLRIAET